MRLSSIGQTVLQILAAGTALALGGRDALAAARPNVVFVLTDDQRFDALGCMGNEIIRTPHIDRLAAGGAVFTNMFCTTSICAINRACLITGQYERRHRVDDFNTPLTDEQFADTFAGRLRAAGYRTGVVGKWGLGGPLPTDKYDVCTAYSGQGRYYPAGQPPRAGTHLTGRLGDQALEFLDECTADRPFLLQVYEKAPHCQDGDPWQFQPDVKYEGLYADAEIPLPRTATDEHFRALPDFLQSSEARVRWHLRFSNPELYQKSVKDYYRLITGVDDLVGRVVAKLEERGLAGNTVIIVSSDNGFYLGEHGLAGKWFMHEESIRVPLIVHDPRSPEHLRGRRPAELALSIDIAPTICELAGVDVPAAMQGRSLVPLLGGEAVGWRDDFLYEHRFPHPRIPQTEGVRTARWKYVRYTSVTPVREELFDLESDPHEEHDLAADPRHATQLAALRTRWRELARAAE
ncbi:MAG TPA: sulfatase [Planctomycetaceae bacterium]|nr:sulfatase [Planctomycetaceae bacterium]